jgi:hypothetical protein
MALLSAFHNLGDAFRFIILANCDTSATENSRDCTGVGHSDALTLISDATAATTGTAITASWIALEAPGWLCR